MNNSKTLADVITLIISYLNQILVLLMAFAVVTFVWYIINYFIKADTDKKEAANYAMYAVIGFFVMLSVWGLVNILSNTFGLGNSSAANTINENVNNLFPR